MNRRPGTRLAVLLAGLAAGGVHAQDRTLTLEQCVELALRQGPAVAAARELYASRHARYESFRSTLLPQVAVQGQAPGYFRSISSVVQPDGSTVFAPQSQANATLGLSISQQVPFTGGEVSLSSSLNRIDLLESKLTSYRSTPLSFSFRQPLFQVNAVGWDIETRALEEERSRREWEEAKEDVALDVTNKFFETSLAAMNVENAAKNVQINDTLHQISIGRYNVGKIAENELLQSELALLNARTQLANATIAHERARKTLAYALGLDKETALALSPPETIPSITLDASMAVAEARRNRSDVLDMRVEETNARRALSEARFATSFSGTLSLNAGFNQRAGTVPEAYRHLLDQQQFSVSFQVPLVQWGAGSSAVEAALADQRRTQVSAAMRMNTLEDEVAAQVSSLQLLQSQVGIAARADTMAQRRFEVSKDRYLIGKIDVTNLFLAQNEKDSARRARVQTLWDYWAGYYRLRRMTLYDFSEGRTLVRPDGEE